MVRANNLLPIRPRLRILDMQVRDFKLMKPFSTKPLWKRPRYLSSLCGRATLPTKPVAKSSTKPTWKLPRHQQILCGSGHVIHQAHVAGATSSSEPMWQKKCHHKIHVALAISSSKPTWKATSSTKPTWQRPHHQTSLRGKSYVIHQAYVAHDTSSTKQIWHMPYHRPS
ncbi:uncharacterized protein G2W53_025794 [Senna tora]|uniref:Uncharacterized protein n=1 Tax=Senna tora TaxID=362788 RepID=A0A834WKM5_9FABA|nr:uncharacterized protein G2W53_025794 [Senna tora]